MLVIPTPTLPVPSDILFLWLIPLSWMVPVVFAGTAVIGELMRRNKRKKLYTPEIREDVKFLIFQIPTIGNPVTVNRIFNDIKQYKLPVPIETWAVIEANDDASKYVAADRIIRVPADFQCYAKAKARALEFARRERLKLVKLGIIPDKYLIIQGDDDSTPTEELVNEALHIKAGLISALIEPGGGSRLTNITDYQRYYACTCSCMIGYNCGRGHPLWGHGEAMLYTAECDKKIDYQFWPLNGKTLHSYDEVFHLGNEDMFWVHKAEAMNIEMYNSEKSVHIQSPFSYKDLYKQRRRWMWGNWNIVYRKRWLPLGHTLRFLLIHVIGMCAYPIAKTGFILDLIGVIQLSPEQRILIWIGFFCWYGIRFYSVYRLKGWKLGLWAAVVSNITTTLDYFAILVGILRGPPKRFEVIQKVK